ncbi:MAG TPA: DUF4142 domain-containing protein [Rhodanobacteraceae bacterium]|nr:DUF4142 domain-containing protein [Rhodanobacteraceae bacterium]
MKATTMVIVGVLAAPLAIGTALAANLSQQDTKWLQGIHQGSQFVIRISEYEEKNGSSPLARKYAQKMVAQDTYVDSRAKEMAKGQHVNLPNALTTKQQQELSEIKATSGTGLDKLYSSTMLKSEIEFGNKTLEEITHGQSQATKNFATFLLPAINLEANMFQHAVSEMKTPV